jgi:hypothetical protein
LVQSHSKVFIALTHTKPFHRFLFLSLRFLSYILKRYSCFSFFKKKILVSGSVWINWCDRCKYFVLPPLCPRVLLVQYLLQAWIQANVRSSIKMNRSRPWNGHMALIVLGGGIKMRSGIPVEYVPGSMWK